MRESVDPIVGAERAPMPAKRRCGSRLHWDFWGYFPHSVVDPTTCHCKPPKAAKQSHFPYPEIASGAARPRNDSAAHVKWEILC